MAKRCDAHENTQTVIDQIKIPMGNLSFVLGALLSHQMRLPPEDLIQGLRKVRANVDVICEMLEGLGQRASPKPTFETDNVLRKRYAQPVHF